MKIIVVAYSGKDVFFLESVSLLPAVPCLHLKCMHISKTLSNSPEQISHHHAVQPRFSTTE